MTKPPFEVGEWVFLKTSPRLEDYGFSPYHRVLKCDTSAYNDEAWWIKLSEYRWVPLVDVRRLTPLEALTVAVAY